MNRGAPAIKRRFEKRLFKRGSPVVAFLSGFATPFERDVKALERILSIGRDFFLLNKVGPICLRSLDDLRAFWRRH